MTTGHNINASRPYSMATALRRHCGRLSRHSNRTSATPAPDSTSAGHQVHATPPWVAGHVPGYTIMLRHFLPDTRYPMATATKRRAKPVLSSLVSAAAVRGAISSGSFATATMSGYASEGKKHVGIRAAHEEHQQAYLTSLLVLLDRSAC